MPIPTVEERVEQLEPICKQADQYQINAGYPVGTPAKEILRHTLTQDRQAFEEAKNNAYRERDMLVCALSKLFPSYLARHDESDTSWEDEWRWIVFIDLPTWQVSWHIHDSERDMFNHLEVKENNWDGHSTDEKYRRLQAIKSIYQSSK